MMNIENELPKIPEGTTSTVTIGVFDGVHRGHAHLISQLSKQACLNKFTPIVLTFKTHPSHILNPNFEPCYLTTLEERINLLKQLHMVEVVPITFDKELSQLPASIFVKLLQTNLGMQSLVVGPDFALGHKREGDVSNLKELGSQMGFTVSVVEPFKEANRIIGSTAIRKALGYGYLETAAHLLGRNFTLPGTVVHGSGRGKSLGFPTANLESPEGLMIPGDGIYAAWAYFKKSRYMAATSVGANPTFRDATRTVEPFLLDFDDNLYDEQLTLEFVRRLRDNVKFDGVEELQRQVAMDVEKTRTILETQG